MIGSSSFQRLVYKNYLTYDHADADAGEIDFGRAMFEGTCPFCQARFKQYIHEPQLASYKKQEETLKRRLHLCNSCGWWQLNFEGEFEINGKKQVVLWWELHHAILVHLDISSDNTAIEDLKTHLARCWDDRKYISAQKAEDLVAGILKDHYRCDIHRVTANANSADGGIDLFLVESDGRIHSAVQVKRRIERDVEAVKEVRDFVGALILEGLERGIFVTTARRYSTPAQRISQNPNLAKHKLELELIDGEKLLDLLRYSISSSSLALPVSIDCNTLWLDDNGKTFSTLNLLFPPDIDVVG
jgi:restriction system protein